mgnify:CR=1 FL=1
MVEFFQQKMDSLFRHESGKMLAVLTRLLGLTQIEAAQDIVQDTLLQAINSWPYSGMPAQPEAWLYKVAKNKAIDYIRRNKKYHEVIKTFAAINSEYAMSASVHNLFLAHEIADSQLRMMFACCHPDISEESQVALVLKTLCGLNTIEIAKAFLCQEETIAKRIYRAKQKLKTGGIPLEVPTAAAMNQRLDTVLQCLYLLFNEGYLSTNHENAIRTELCSEAIRLCKLLCENEFTGLPKTHAMIALFCYQASRLEARLDDDGQLVLLQDQDRTKWNYFLIERGHYYMNLAGNTLQFSHWHLEAAIAGAHASATTFEATDWALIYKLYQVLYTAHPTWVVALNKAIAANYAEGPELGLNLLLQIDTNHRCHLWYSTLAEIYSNQSQQALAIDALITALNIATAPAEQKMIEKKIKHLQNAS